MIVTERERGRDTGRGRSRLQALGAWRGIWSRVSRIAPWAKGRRQTAAPPRDPLFPYHLCVPWSSTCHALKDLFFRIHHLVNGWRKRPSFWPLSALDVLSSLSWIISSFWLMDGFKDFIYLFMTDTEREAETQAEGEAGSMHREPDVGFDPGSPGSRPGPKAGAKPLRHPGIP